MHGPGMVKITERALLCSFQKHEVLTRNKYMQHAVCISRDMLNSTVI